MIIFENSILRLDYDPANDILVIVYPDLHGYLLPELKRSVDILAEKVRNYDVKKVLLDSSRTVVSVTPEESRAVSMYLASALAQTRLQKLARVESLDATVKVRASENLQHIQQTLALPYLLRNFRQKEEALTWLQSETPAL
ncbi:hypothetical protein [uncultured Pontibacter sp.]|uniref:hypothetical protein n=1 Tax=uncultured Pontibacter sp. TaxID=453356 RepID=UPI0026353B2E|nr:hypothetical protein [uncultured Pontibacter sp.]